MQRKQLSYLGGVSAVALIFTIGTKMSPTADLGANTAAAPPRLAPPPPTEGAHMSLEGVPDALLQACLSALPLLTDVRRAACASPALRRAALAVEASITSASAASHFDDEQLRGGNGGQSEAHVPGSGWYAVREVLQRLPNLRSLDLGGAPWVNHELISWLVKCPALEHLDLRGCPNINDTAVLQLGALATLRTLDLTYCPGVTFASVVALRTGASTPPGLQCVRRLPQWL
jgi:hypothetical protein